MSIPNVVTKREKASMVLMIDSPTTRDRDDAFRVDRLGDGTWRIAVHVAAVADHVPAGHPADDRARQVGWSQYRANGVTPMLGRALEDAATLKHREARGSLVITVTLSADGTVRHTDVRRGRTENAIATTYSAAAQRLVTSGNDSMSKMLQDAHELATLLLARRRASGALAIYDLTRGYAVSEDGALVKLGDAEAHPTYIIVQEMMIAANAALAHWAVKNVVPILFRNHQAHPFAPEVSEVAADFDAALRSPEPERDLNRLIGRNALVMQRATYGSNLQGHYGLNLPAYTHATSPLRRYADLASQRNVLAFLDNSPLPHSKDDLDAIAEALRLADDVRRHHTHEREKAVDEQRTLRAVDHVDGNLSALTSDRWLKTLKLAARGPLIPAVEAEIGRRTDAGTLEHAALGLILNASDESWAPVRTLALRHVKEDRPASASMLLNEHRQQHPATVVDVITTTSGPSHAPLFESQVTVNTTALPVEVAHTAKDASHRAALAALRFLHAIPHEPSGATTPARLESVRPSLPVDVNPIGWLNEHAQRNRLPQPTFEASAAGPSHAPEHIVTIKYAGAPGVSFHAAAGSKSEARTNAAALMRDAIRGITH